MSAVAGLVAMLGYAPINIRRARKIRHVQGFSKGGTLASSACSLVSFTAFFLCALEYLLDGPPHFICSRLWDCSAPPSSCSRGSSHPCFVRITKALE